MLSSICAYPLWGVRIGCVCVCVFTFYWSPFFYIYFYFFFHFARVWCGSLFLCVCIMFSTASDTNWSISMQFTATTAIDSRSGNNTFAFMAIVRWRIFLFFFSFANSKMTMQWMDLVFLSVAMALWVQNLPWACHEWSIRPPSKYSMPRRQWTNTQRRHTNLFAFCHSQFLVFFSCSSSHS